MRFVVRIIAATLFVSVLVSAAAVKAQTNGVSAVMPPHATNVVIVDRSGRMRNFPCTQCHSLIKKAEGRRDAAHVEVKLKHGEINRDCLNCHDAENKNSLRLMVSGEKIPFESSYKLCSQCHGNILKDWESGVHGLQTGFWNGTKNRRTCTACHDPHTPAFKAMKPLPPPEQTRGQ